MGVDAVELEGSFLLDVISIGVLVKVEVKGSGVTGLQLKTGEDMLVTILMPWTALDSSLIFLPATKSTPLIALLEITALTCS